MSAAPTVAIKQWEMSDGASVVGKARRAARTNAGDDSGGQNRQRAVRIVRTPDERPGKIGFLVKKSAFAIKSPHRDIGETSAWGGSISTVFRKGVTMSLESANALFDGCANDEERAVATAPVAQDRTGARRADALFTLTYSQLKQIARRTRNRDAHTLNTTGLVHELFLKLKLGSDPEFGANPQFFAYAARAMRHILLDRALRRSRTKLGGDVVHTELGDAMAQQVAADPAIAMQLDAALSALERDDARAAQAFELHYFGGLQIEKVAEVLGVSKRTADRDWRFARAFLSAQMGS